MIREIPGVESVLRRTGRAERDQHAEPPSTSELTVRVDMKADAARIRDRIRAALAEMPGVSSMVGYPIAHRSSAALSGAAQGGSRSLVSGKGRFALSGETIWRVVTSMSTHSVEAQPRGVPSGRVKV